jgi:hypothetical protein
MANITINQKPTSAFYAQANISFGVSVCGVLHRRIRSRCAESAMGPILVHP